MSTSRHKLALARSRSRRRKDSAGATMFIVSITLALLAVMGVYGMTATSNDVRAAGHGRQRAQALHAAELAGMIAVEMYNAANATGLVEEMKRRWTAEPVGSQRCWAAKPKSGAPNYRLDEACLSYTERDIPALFGTTWKGLPFFSPESIDSFHNDAPRDQLRPFVKIEVTNPVDTPTPNGILTQLTVTIYVWVALPSGTPGEPARPYDEVFKARGFITVPSLQRPQGAPTG